MLWKNGLHCNYLRLGRFRTSNVSSNGAMQNSLVLRNTAPAKKYGPRQNPARLSSMACIALFQETCMDNFLSSYLFVCS